MENKEDKVYLYKFKNPMTFVYLILTTHIYYTVLLKLTMFYLVHTILKMYIIYVLNT